MNDSLETDLKKELLINIENIDSLTQCAICIEYFNKDRHTPVTSSCGCKTLICTDCYSGLMGTGARCPTCRGSVSWSNVPVKIIDLMLEFIKMKDVTEQFIVASEKINKSKQLLEEVFKYKPESEAEQLTLETIMNLVYKLTQKASNMELTLNNRIAGKVKELEKKEKSLDEREKSIVDKEVNISVMTSDLDAREYNVSQLEVEQNNVRKLESELKTKMDEYNFLASGLNEQSDMIKQNEQLVNIREESLTDAEKALKIRENDFESLQKVLESEMNQLLQDKEEFEIKQLSFAEQMKDLERKVITHQADISSFKKKEQKINKLIHNSDDNEIDMEELENMSDDEDKSEEIPTPNKKNNKLPFIFSYN